MQAEAKRPDFAALGTFITFGWLTDHTGPHSVKSLTVLRYVAARVLCLIQSGI